MWIIATLATTQIYNQKKKKKKKKTLILVTHNLGLHFPSEKKQRGLAKAGSQVKV
jgi:hypothetical protein